MTKAKTPKPPEIAPTSARGDVRRQGKKNVRWQDDPDILARLVLVADLMNRHRPAFEIAAATQVSIETTRRDIARVRETWKNDSLERLRDARDIANAQYAAVINQAWADMQTAQPNNPARAAYQNVILRAQRQMDSVNGIATKHEITGPDGGPIEVAPADMEQVRRKRWEQVAPSLSAITNKESNDEQPSPEEKP